ncbi:MAG: type IV pilus modification protein PilV [Pseudorhodoferax sp.]
MLSRPARQAGITLLESLVAMLVLSVGIGALAWAQARHLADGRDTAARSMAVLLTEDLADRMLFNRSAAANGGYRLAWGERPAPADCRSGPCPGSALARADLSAWRDALAQALPDSDAHVFAAGGSGRQMGIAISWRWTGASALAPSTGFDCPAQSNCHVTYVPF